MCFFAKIFSTFDHRVLVVALYITEEQNLEKTWEDIHFWGLYNINNNSSVQRVFIYAPYTLFWRAGITSVYLDESYENKTGKKKWEYIVL